MTRSDLATTNGGAARVAMLITVGASLGCAEIVGIDHWDARDGGGGASASLSAVSGSGAQSVGSSSSGTAGPACGDGTHTRGEYCEYFAAPPQDYPVPTTPGAAREIALARLGGEPDLVDLVVLAPMGAVGLVYWSVNLGSGTFGDFANVASPGAPARMVVGKVTVDDDRDDVLTLDPFVGKVNVLLSVPDGMGTLELASENQQVGAIYDIAIGQSNGRVTYPVLLADGASGVLVRYIEEGSLAGTETITMMAPTMVLARDLNGDGRSDIVAAGGKAVMTALASELSYGAVTSIDIAEDVTGIAVGDLVGDQLPDIVALTGRATYLLPNGGNGMTFAEPKKIADAKDFTHAEVADFNGDGHGDLLGMGAMPGVLTVLLGSPTGDFTKIEEEHVGQNLAPPVIGNLNDDGVPDIVVLDRATSTVRVFLSHP